MQRIDRFERALRAFIDRVELDCKTHSSKHLSIDEILVAFDCGALTVRPGMDQVTVSLLRGIKEMRDALNGKGGAPVPRRKPKSPLTPKNFRVLEKEEAT